MISDLCRKAIYPWPKLRIIKGLLNVGNWRVYYIFYYIFLSLPNAFPVSRRGWLLITGNIYQIRKKVCKVRDVLQLINSIVYYHSNQSYRHKYISLHNFTIYAEFVCKIWIIERKNISIINGSAKLQYHSISLHQNIMNKLLIRLLRSKDQDDHNFLPPITYNIHENDFSRLW